MNSSLYSGLENCFRVALATCREVFMCFKNILGHDFQKMALIRAVRDNRISHSYAFFGPAGVGKKLIALDFAKILNCINPREEVVSKEGFCDCHSCKKIDKGIHPDVFLVEFEGAKDIKVDQIRDDVEERLSFRPFEGKFKVAIIDEAERMNANAQNAFLKTLEEPPADSIVILVTSQPEYLLPTIRSRCQIVEFGGLPEQDLLDEIRKKTGLSIEEAWFSVKASRGSLGKALSLDKEILDERKEILSKLSGVNPRYASQVLSFVESMPTGSSTADMERLEFFLDVISLWLRDLVLVRLGFSEEALSNRDLEPLGSMLTDGWSVSEILDKIKVLEISRRAIFRGNANKQIVLEDLVLNIAG